MGFSNIWGRMLFVLKLEQAILVALLTCDLCLGSWNDGYREQKCQRGVGVQVKKKLGWIRCLIDGETAQLGVASNEC